jgi:hypothetical protein
MRIALLASLPLLLSLLLLGMNGEMPETADASGNQTKTFFASNLDAGRQDARQWVSAQTDIQLTIDSTHRVRGTTDGGDLLPQRQYSLPQFR